MRWLLVILAIVPLAGCVTSQGGTHPMALGPDTADNTSQCVRYGFPADTPAFGDCNKQVRP